MLRILFLALVVFLVLFPEAIYAQPGDPGPKPGVPFTGIEILLAAGGLFGAKKLYDSRKRNKQE